ncbi:MAG: DUF1461 domain-containing protein [Nanoarchaeota archaeon]
MAMKMRKERIERIMFFLFVVALVLAVFLSSFSHYVFNQGFYTSEHKKNGASQKLDEKTAHNITQNLFAYYQQRDSLKHFTPQEQFHLKDVKGVIQLMFIIYSFAVLIIVFALVHVFWKHRATFSKNRKQRHLFDYRRILLRIFKAVRIAGLVSLAIILLLFLFELVGGFGLLFTGFHSLFFPQGNWQFPADSLLITLFPEQFFRDIAEKIFVRSFVIAVLLYFASSGASLALAKHEPLAD